MGTVEELAVDILRACQQSETAELKILLHQVCNLKDLAMYSVVFVGLCRMFVFTLERILAWMENEHCLL